MKKAYLLIIVCLLSFSPSLWGKSVEDAFEALKIYNYFEAKRLFEKKMKKTPGACSYGLACIYSRNDNPFYQIDSAFACIQRAEKYFASTKEKWKERLQKYQYTELGILELKRKISTVYYRGTLQENTEEAYQQFLKAHPWANERFDAIRKRDSIAFYDAMIGNSISSFQTFLKKYPDSQYARMAQHEVDSKVYQRETKQKKLADYLKFIKNYPESPYIPDAEKQVFQLQTSLNTVESYEQYIRNFPNSRYVEQAWKKLFQIYMYDYSKARIASFREKYPDYPFQEDLDQELVKASRELLPFSDGGKFGWMDREGKIVFPAEYELLSIHHEGLAMAVHDGKIGFVDKNNELQIAFEYDDATDFEGGLSVVEKEGKMGIIDRSGKVIFDFVFEDIGSFSEGMVYAQKDSLYAYYDRYGNQVVAEKFDEAFSFQKGLALVVIGEFQNYINQLGNPQFPNQFVRLNQISEGLFVFSNGDKYGLISKDLEVIQVPIYDQIASLSEGFIAFSREGKIGFFDESGQVAIPPIYDELLNFANVVSFTGGFARVRFNGKFGLIDDQGKWIIPARYHALGSVSERLAFQQEDKWGYLGLNHKELIAPTFDEAESFDGATAIVRLEGNYGVIDTLGRAVIPITFERVDRVYDKLYVCSSEQGKQLFFEDGTLLSEEHYDQIRMFSEELLILANSKGVAYFDLLERRLIKKQD